MTVNLRYVTSQNKCSLQPIHLPARMFKHISTDAFTYGINAVWTRMKPIQSSDNTWNTNKWRFPEIGVPPNHPFLDGIFPYKPSIWGYLHLWKPPNEQCSNPIGTSLIPVARDTHNRWLVVLCRFFGACKSTTALTRKLRSERQL